jgi:hypothetical protein
VGSEIPAGKHIQSGIPNTAEYCSAGQHLSSLRFPFGQESRKDCVMHEMSAK